MRRWMFTVVAVVACAAWLWQWQGASPPPAHPHTSGAHEEGQVTGARTGDGSPTELNREQLQDRSATASGGASDRLWRVRLTGLFPGVPWSSQLTLVVEDRRHIDVLIDEHGTGTFEPPAIARNPAFQMLRIVANDPNYEIARNGRRMDDLQLYGEDSFEVRPISLLRGRVLRPPGFDGEVRVRAFPMTTDGPSEAEIARTGVDGQGEYVLRVPPDAPMLVVADAVDHSRHRSGPFTGFAPNIAQLFGGRDGVDHRDADATTVPASLQAEGTFGQPRRIADLQLTRAERLTGRVTYADGSAVADLWCTTRPVDAASWRGDLQWNGTRVFATNNGYTDANGNFTVWLPPGVPFVVTATSTNPLLLAGEPSTTASAPGHVQLTAPGDPVTIEVVRDNRAAKAVVVIDGMEVPTDDQGRLAVTLGSQAVRVQARTPKLAAVPQLLRPGSRPSTVRLELEPEILADARIRLRAERPILQAVFCWQPVAGGRTRRMHASRKSEAEPFAMEVPPGDYRLEVLADPDATPAASPGRYLRFAPTTCIVAASGLAADYEVALGGKLALTVLDRSGTPVRASFTLTDSAGTAHAPQTAGRTASGDLQVAPPGEVLPVPRSEIVDVLPHGRYELVVDTGRGREQRSTVTVEACRTAHETIRLP